MMQLMGKVSHRLFFGIQRNGMGCHSVLIKPIHVFIQISGKQLNRIHLWNDLLLYGQINAALLANLQEVPVNIGNQAVGGLLNGFQAGPKLRQLLSAAPVGDITEAVLAGFNAIILAHRIGDAFGLHFLGMPVFGLGRFFCVITDSGGKAFFLIVVELGMGDLMDSGAYRLYLAHIVPKGDALILRVKIAIHSILDRPDFQRHRGSTPQGLHENLVIPHAAGQVAGKLGEGPALGLGNIEHGHHLKPGDGNFFFLHNCVSVLIQHGSFGIRVALDFLNFFLVGSGRDDLDTLFAPLYMTPELVAPFVKTGHMGSMGILQMNERDVVDRVAVKAGHHTQILHIFLAFKQLFDSLLNAFSDFPQPFLIGLLRFSHNYISFPGLK